MPFIIPSPRPALRGSEHVGESINLAPGATLAFRICADVQEVTEVICQFFTATGLTGVSWGPCYSKNPGKPWDSMD